MQWATGDSNHGLVHGHFLCGGCIAARGVGSLIKLSVRTQRAFCQQVPMTITLQGPVHSSKLSMCSGFSVLVRGWSNYDRRASICLSTAQTWSIQKFQYLVWVGPFIGPKCQLRSLPRIYSFWRKHSRDTRFYSAHCGRDTSKGSLDICFNQIFMLIYHAIWYVFRAWNSWLNN